MCVCVCVCVCMCVCVCVSKSVCAHVSIMIFAIFINKESSVSMIEHMFIGVITAKVY